MLSFLCLASKLNNRNSRYIHRAFYGTVDISARLLTIENGRSGEVRTHDPLVPNQVRCLTALHSDKLALPRGLEPRLPE